MGGRDSACRMERLAFYDASETNDRALKVLREDTLQHIVRGLAGTIRRNVTIDWTHCENIRARLHVMVRRILREHGYPLTRKKRPPKLSSNKPNPSPKTGPQPDARQTASYPTPTTGTCSYSSRSISATISHIQIEAYRNCFLPLQPFIGWGQFSIVHVSSAVSMSSPRAL